MMRIHDSLEVEQQVAQGYTEGWRSRGRQRRRWTADMWHQWMDRVSQGWTSTMHKRADEDRDNSGERFYAPKTLLKAHGTRPKFSAQELVPETRTRNLDRVPSA